MEQSEARYNYGQYRKQLYASINGRKGNMVTLSKSNLLSTREKELVLEVIDALEKLRVEISNSRNKAIITAKQSTKAV